MLYRIARWKLESQDLQSFKQGLIPITRRRTFTKRPVKVGIPAVPKVDQREVAFRYFTQIASIDRKRKNKRGYHLKNEKSNTFLAWLGMSANNSSAIIVSGCNAIWASASTKNITPRKSVGSYVSASTVWQLMERLETFGDLYPSTSSLSNSYQLMTKIIGMEHNPVVKNVDVQMTNPNRNKALKKKVDPIDLIVAMLKGLSLDDKRKTNESDKEHFEAFQAHKIHARPYVKRMKASNN